MNFIKDNIWLIIAIVLAAISYFFFDWSQISIFNLFQ